MMVLRVDVFSRFLKLTVDSTIEAVELVCLFCCLHSVIILLLSCFLFSLYRLLSTLGLFRLQSLNIHTCALNALVFFWVFLVGIPSQGRVPYSVRKYHFYLLAWKKKIPIFKVFFIRHLSREIIQTHQQRTYL